MTALITGGSGSIGAACADTFLSANYSVILADRNADALSCTAKRLQETHPQGTIESICFDASSPKSIAHMFDTAAKRTALDVLVTCAGVICPEPSLDTTEEQWDHVIDVNLKGVFFCCQEAAKYMRTSGGGSIVNISSIAAETAWPRRASYAASKMGVNQLTKTLATEWAEYHIRVNAVGPAWVDTELIKPAVAKGYINLEAIKRAVPLGRLASPKDIAEAVFFLAGSKASYITGQVLYVDGGYLTGSPSIAVQDWSGS